MNTQGHCFTLAVLAIASLWFATPVWGAESQLVANFSPKCPTTDYPQADTGKNALGAVIGAAFIGKFVDWGIQEVKKMLVPGKETRTESTRLEGLYRWVAEGSKAKLSVNPDLGCLIVAYGPVGTGTTWKLPESLPQRPEVDASGVPKFARAAGEDAVSLLASKVNLSGPPTIYLEAIFVKSQDETALALIPVRLYVNEFLSGNFFSGNRRNLAFVISLSAPDKPATAFYSQSLTFNSVAKGWDPSAADLKLLVSNNSAWGMLKGPSEKAMKAVDVSVSHANNTAAQNAVVDKPPYDPVTLSVQLVEEPQPYALAQIFADTISDTSVTTALKSSLDAALIPSVRAQQELTSMSATTAALKQFQSDYTDFLKAKTDATTAGTAEAKYKCSVLHDIAFVSRQKAAQACQLDTLPACDLPQLSSCP